jgi:predicted  nucleic acid-binding Zn-ribbon protein
VGPSHKGEILIVIDVLNILIQLQEIDSQIINLKQKTESLPLKIKKLDQLAEEIDKQFENERKKLSTLEKQKKDKERDIDEINDKIKKLKEKTSQIKTNKEYQALLKEIESFEEALKKEEENLLLIMYELDETKRNLEDSKKNADLKKKELELEKIQVEEEIKRVNQSIDTLIDERRGFIDKLPKEIYDEYKELMKKHKGIAVSEVKNSVCQGCFLHIPPQLYVEIKLNQSIYHCPQCGRILFYKKEENKEEKAVSE